MNLHMLVMSRSMLDAAVCGEVLLLQLQTKILEAIRAVHTGDGVLPLLKLCW